MGLKTVVFPAHPRTRKALVHMNARLENHVRLIDPVAYFDMMMLEEHARLIATDSGGVQREAYFLGIPCLTLRDETEWVETVEAGWNTLVGADANCIGEAVRTFTPASHGLTRPTLYGDGRVAERIAKVLEVGVRIEETTSRSQRSDMVAATIWEAGPSSGQQ